MTGGGRAEDGFTLIETVIAMLVMSLAVVTIVGALAAMFTFTAEHRGFAVVETSTRSFGQAAQAQASFATRLPPGGLGVTASDTSFDVEDDSLLPPASTDSYIMIDREVMRLTAVTRSVDAGADSITVVRGVGSTTATAHAAGATVAPFLRCSSGASPDDTLLYTPESSTYTKTAGLVIKVTGVSYWRPNPTDPSTGSFVSRGECANDSAAICPSGAILPECMSGLVRLNLSITAAAAGAPVTGAYDQRLKNVSTTTTLLVRRGGG